MRFAVLFVAIASFFLAVSAVPSQETNAQRLARGLGPLRPRNLGSPIGSAKRSATSATVCAGSWECCSTLTTASNGWASFLIGLWGVTGTTKTTPVGLTCSKIATATSTCSKHVACCATNSWDGVVAVNCVAP